MFVEVYLYCNVFRLTFLLKPPRAQGEGLGPGHAVETQESGQRGPAVSGRSESSVRGWGGRLGSLIKQAPASPGEDAPQRGPPRWPGLLGHKGTTCRVGSGPRGGATYSSSRSSRSRMLFLFCGQL